MQDYVRTYGRTDGRTDGRTSKPALLGRLGGVNLKKLAVSGLTSENEIEIVDSKQRRYDMQCDNAYTNWQVTSLVYRTWPKTVI